MKSKRWLLAATLCAALGSGSAAAFDFDHEMVPFVVGPTVLPTIFAISPTGGDASIVLRSTMFFSTAWFDATSPYTPHGVGLFSTIPNRPASEHTQRNQNIAAFYASFHAAMSLWPAQETEWRNMLLDVGLDPDDDSTDLTTPIGIGNVAGAGLVEAYEHDGMNQLGDGNGRGNFFRRPYEDTTGYEPVNNSHTLKDPSRWQPLQSSRGGLFSSQEFVTPQWANTQAFGFDDVSVFRVAKPLKSDWQHNKAGYRQQADAVLNAQRNLTDEQKMLSELFLNKVYGLGQSVAIIAFARGLNMRQIIELDMITHAAAWDAGIIVWKEKIRFDTVRPITAIRFLYGNQNIRAWGGPGKGIVNNVPGKYWTPYLPTPDHPEYPSGSTSFCAAHAQAVRRYFNGDDSFGWTINFPAGSSFVEPGVTPAVDTSFTFDTWTEFETVCGNTRVWAGSHFPDAVNNVKAVARQAGDLAADYVLAHIDGSWVGDGDDDDHCNGHGHGHGNGNGHH